MIGNEEEEEEEEEEYLVHVEFDGLLDSNILDRPNVFLKVIGIDTDKPVMQIEQQVFVGQYRDTVGTALFFEENPSPITDDPVFGKNTDVQLRYVCKTRKSLLMSRVFLKPKEENSEKVSTSQTTVEKESNENEDDIQMSVDEDEATVEDIPAPSPQETFTTSVQESKGKAQCFEPIPGPSWAPDITELQYNSIPGTSFEKSVNTDDMSRLIAEQMTIASDINMQNALSSRNETCD